MIEAIKAWAARYAADGRYSPVGQIFHWTMAALILFQLGWGWRMSRIDAGGDKLEAFRVHAELGLLMLVLAALRAIWRMIVPGPVNDADRLGWQTVAAYVTHILFYVCFFGLPLCRAGRCGRWSAASRSKSRWILLAAHDPARPRLDKGFQWWTSRLGGRHGHALLIILLVAMIPLHVGAALKHHFWDRHDVLRGMLPELPEDGAETTPDDGTPPPARRARAGG